MKLQHCLGVGLLMLLLPTAAALAADAVQDPDISVHQVVQQFPPTILGSSSNPIPFIITNHGAAVLPLGPIALGGVNPAEFTLGATTCTATLAPAASCTVEVSFKPVSKGTKNATLQISYGSGKILTAFVTNYTSKLVEAQRRLPPVLADTTIPDTLVPGTTYTLTWSMEGYEDMYKNNLVLFDCTGISDGSCGNTYDDATRFAESTFIPPVAVESPGNCSFGGFSTKHFNYSWTFTVPATRVDGSAWAASPGTEIVARFFQKSAIDEAHNNISVSLLIPGNQAAKYYDTSGRRIVKWIVAP